MVNPIARQIFIAVLAGMLLGAPVTVQAQQAQPSAAAMAAAKEIMALKGAESLYDAIVPGAIEDSKRVLLQVNPMVSRPLNEVAEQLKGEYRARTGEVLNIVYRLYASRFTEAELKDLLAFYKSPLGQKVTKEEPKILEESMSGVGEWLQKFGEEVIAKMRAEMRKRGHEL